MRNVKVLPWQTVIEMCEKILPHMPKDQAASLSNQFQERLPERLVTFCVVNKFCIL